MVVEVQVYPSQTTAVIEAEFPVWHTLSESWQSLRFALPLQILEEGRQSPKIVNNQYITNISIGDVVEIIKGGNEGGLVSLLQQLQFDGATALQMGDVVHTRRRQIYERPT
ncbi:MAG: hypothetical protein GXN93_03260 [Candidatus Diapherotrites archaeon]|nr:hypothetical protein [Candidatus Diapherotrites archaeon]